MTIYKKGILILTIVLSFGLIMTGCTKSEAKKKTEQSTAVTSATVESDQKQNEGAESYSIDQLTGAVISNELALVEKILASGSVDVNSTDLNGKYPLELTLTFDNFEMAQLLLSNGADANIKMESGETVKEKVMVDGTKAMQKLFNEY